MMYKRYFKRFFDFLMALTGLILISPLFILLMLILFFANQGAGIFFTQKRPGKNEKIFNIIKFKTMTDARDSKGNLLPDSDRLTKVGRFIRISSLDEIPQLINVLKGEMSIVGPRPFRAYYLPYYTEHERKRHSAKPGLTGLAQINGGKSLDWETKFKLDVTYVEKMSFTLDIIIIVKTILKLLTRSATAEDEPDVLVDFDEYRKRQRDESLTSFNEFEVNNN